MYAPQAGRPQSEKEASYEKLQEIIKHIPQKGPYDLAGEWNAKVQEYENEEEAIWIGKHTFCRSDDTTWQQSEEVEANREDFLQLCRTLSLTACNTKFEKQSNKLATWRAIGTTGDDPWTRQHYDQIDFIY